jgi:hypothetical protein
LDRNGLPIVRKQKKPQLPQANAVALSFAAAAVEQDQKQAIQRRVSLSSGVRPTSATTGAIRPPMLRAGSSVSQQSVMAQQPPQQQQQQQQQGGTTGPARGQFPRPGSATSSISQSPTLSDVVSPTTGSPPPIPGMTTAAPTVFSQFVVKPTPQQASSPATRRAPAANLVTAASPDPQDDSDNNDDYDTSAGVVGGRSHGGGSSLPGAPSSPPFAAAKSSPQAGQPISNDLENELDALMGNMLLFSGQRIQSSAPDMYARQRSNPLYLDGD